MDQNLLPKHIFGMHDRGAERLFSDADRRGWIVLSEEASHGGGNFSDLSDAGFGVIVRLNNGYGSAGTIPFPVGYDAFAAACAQYVANSSGAHIWIIGNETNLASERPGNTNTGNDGEKITPKLYADCFAKCRAAIRAVPGHGDDWVVPSPPGPWNAQTAYDGNPSGDWVDYFRDLLNECVKRGAPPDALALHTYTLNVYDAGLVTSEQRHDNPSHNTRHLHFRAYQDFLSVVPPALRDRPVFITESQANPWEDRDIGWIQAAYAEINNWNAGPSNQPIQALVLFRWQRGEEPPESGWGISDKGGVVNDLRAALQNDYRVRWLSTAPAPVPVTPAPIPFQPLTDKVLPLAKARWFTEETVRKLEAQDGGAARDLLMQTIIPWFYATAPKHSTALENAQAHTAARWNCEEAVRQIEAQQLNSAADTLRFQVLPWLYSPGPQAIGILSVKSKPKPKPKAKAKSKTKAAPRKKAAAKPRAKSRSTKSSAPKKKRASK